MKQSKLATQILNMLDPQKRKSMIYKIAVLMTGSFLGLVWANGWESPLAVIPRSLFGILLGYFLVYIQSINLYPRIEHYFNLEALKRDAEMIPPPLPSAKGDHESSDK